MVSVTGPYIILGSDEVFGSGFWGKLRRPHVMGIANFSEQVVFLQRLYFSYF